MARIDKAEHSKILQAVDVERRKVAEVAAEYDCTPANIYALLGKLRRATNKGIYGTSNPGTPPALAPHTPATTRAGRDPLEPVEQQPTSDLFGAAAGVTQQGSARPARLASKRHGQSVDKITRAPAVDAASATPPSKPADQGRASQALPALPSPVVKPAMVKAPAQRGPVKNQSVVVAASLAKPGFGLVMRTTEGDDGLTPFRSLDDLLSAVKPILRAAARSQDVIWFSIQPIDVALLDSDAA